MGKSRHSRKSKKSPGGTQKRVVNNPSATYDRPETNQRIQFTIIPVFSPENPKNKINRLPEGEQGLYKVTYVLAIPGKEVFKDDLDFVKIMQAGTSLLQVKPGTVLKLSIFNENDNAEILFFSNSSGLISQAEMRIDASNFKEAEKVSHDLIMQQLSYWSYLYDISLDIAGCELIEEKTESKRYHFGVVGKIKPFNKFNGFESVSTYRRFFAAYREGMNATNIFYQALSFYKVIEGVVAERIREKRRTKNEIPIYSNEIFPKNIDNLIFKDELTITSFQPYLEQSFDFVKDQFRELIRNAIAHLSQLEGALDSDSYDDFITCSKSIPVLHYIARIMLENEINKNSTI